MPNPGDYSDKSEFMSDCMRITKQEGKSRDQGVAQCLNMWRQEHGEKKALMVLKVASTYLTRESGLSSYLREPSEIFKEIKGKTIIVFDTETTGLNHNRNQVTEIAAVALKGPEFEEVGQYHKKIKLTDKTLKQIEDEKEKAKDPKFFGVEKVLNYNKYHKNPLTEEDEMDVLEGFKDFCGKFGKPILLGQNAKFDMAFIGGRVGNIPRERVYDTKLFAQYFFLPAVKALSSKGIFKEEVRKRLLTKEYKTKKKQDPPKVQRGEPGWRKKFREIPSGVKKELSTSLEYLMKGFGKNERGAHSSLTDVRSTAKVFQKMIGFFEEYGDFTENSEYKREHEKGVVQERNLQNKSRKREMKENRTFRRHKKSLEKMAHTVACLWASSF